MATVRLDNFSFKGTGELTGETSATQLPDRSCIAVLFRAPVSNTGDVYIGGPGVTVPDGSTDTTSGIELSPGDFSPFLPCGNLNEFYRICDNAGDDLLYMIWEK